MKLFWHKLRHWEYWSMYVVYAPTIFLWVAYALRLKSFRFYRFSNPAIKNAGLYDDCKFDIYNLLPKNWFPKTCIVRNMEPTNIAEVIKNESFEFPLIVKPDVGCRGVMVKKVNTIEEILQYKSALNADFLIQEICEYPNEIGLFYYRFPDQKKGHISGITGKVFLSVLGDGIRSLEELLAEKPRFRLQIPTLKKQMDLSEILPKDEQRCLVPFGNHNRGTEFLDYSQKINAKLEEVFNVFLGDIDGFYYGRLDIRYNTWQELENGINFSIIEVNGAKSEPTHIYDPKHSFWYGQKEIYRHQRIFFKIIRQSIKLSKSPK